MNKKVETVKQILKDLNLDKVFKTVTRTSDGTICAQIKIGSNFELTSEEVSETMVKIRVLACFDGILELIGEDRERVC